jgi:hypothetical protein
VQCGGCESNADCDDENQYTTDTCDLTTCGCEHEDIPHCGDQICSDEENCVICPQDCGICPPSCGDQVCNNDETCETCPLDCGDCPPVCPDVIVISNTDNDVFSTEDVFLNKAVFTYDENAAWTPVITDAYWIWKSYLVENPKQNETYRF